MERTADEMFNELGYEKYENETEIIYRQNEIVNDELRDYRFYADDMLHPSAQAVDYIFERFSEYAFSDETFAFAQEWKKIEKAINHRPNYLDTKEYRAFVEKTQERLVFLSKKYANLAVEKEVEELNKRISSKQSNI